jgi:hypothetical protein
MNAARKPLFAIAVVLLVLAALVGAALLYRFDPAQYGFYPRCQFHAMTGLQCPGCGGLRAVHALLHGHVAEAVRLNALFVAALPVALAFAGWRSLSRRRATSSPQKCSMAWVWIFVAAVMTFAVVRNLPGVSFAWATP